MNVLGIETSCDETAAAVVRDGREVLSNVVFSQTELHARYGGVVPEIASRSHVESLPSVMESAVVQSGLNWSDLDAVAVTHGPGLGTSLVVGVAAAKGLATRLKLPLRAVNHVEAHIYSVFLGTEAPLFDEACPFVALVVSGGHTCLIRADRPGRYALLGQTVDDAAGEAFDKAAKLLGLGYPGGPAVEKAAKGKNPNSVRFPRARHKRYGRRLCGLDPDLCFSFSGVKTSLAYYLKNHAAPRADVGSLAASFQEAIVDALTDRCRRAMTGARTLAVAGGVALNGRLRGKLSDLAARIGFRLMLAEPRYCADNAAMVAGLAGWGGGLSGDEAMLADGQPDLPPVMGAS